MIGRPSSSGNDDTTTPKFWERIYEWWSSVRKFLYGLRRRISEQWPGVRDVLHERWSSVRDVFYGLKVAWVSVASVVLGALLFLMAPQVQDLFLEIKGNTAKSAGFWLFFYVSVMVAWGLPVYVSSRWILSRFEQGSPTDAFPDVKSVQTWVRRRIPPLLAVGCFAAVLLGQLMELRNVPSRSWTRGTSYGGIYVDDGTLVLFYYAILAVALCWLYAHRRLNSLLHRGWRIGGKIIWWLVTAALIIPLLLITVISILVATEDTSYAFGLRHLVILPALTLISAYLAWRGLKPSRDRMVTPIGAMMLRLRGIRRIVDEKTATKQIVAPLYQVALFTSLVALTIAFVLHPVHVTEYVYRAPMLPLLLGILVAPLTYVSYWSLRSRAPLVFIIILIPATLTLIWGDHNDVRTVPNVLPCDTLEQAVNRWAAVNGCNVATEENARACPSPFIISVAGGASRAAFHVAGAIGKLMDDTTLTANKGSGLAFSPDGTRIVTRNNWEQPPRLWDAKTGKEIAVLKGHLDSVGIAAFSPDGTRIVTTLARHWWEGKNPRLWDAKTGKEIAVLKGHQDAVKRVAFSPDGTRIVTTAYDRKPRLWDAKTGIEIATLKGHLESPWSPAWSPAFSPDGMRILTTAEADNVALILEAKTGKEIAPLKGHQGTVWRAAFSPDGTRILTSAYDETPRLWDAKTGIEIVPPQGPSGHGEESRLFARRDADSHHC